MVGLKRFRIASGMFALFLAWASSTAAGANRDYEDSDGSDETPLEAARNRLTLGEIRKTYRVLSQDGKPLKAHVPSLPDLSLYTPAILEAKINPAKPGKVQVGPLLGESGFKSLTTAIGQGLREFAVRQRGSLRAIIIEDGYVELSQLAKSLPKGVFEETSPAVFVARLPILIRHGASLQIGPDAKQLRLSQDRGALIANEGALFVVRSEVSGWNEQRGAPALFRSQHEFRPFIVSWGGSETYISESRIAHLGYAVTKSFGLSLSQYSSNSMERQAWPRPKGWVLKSVIEDLWYGFYCWEADDLVLRGNTFRNNIKYGIDPHDRSHRLIIAENDVSGTRVKHGIIISREVNDSWIIHNKSYENNLSGIVLDRQCTDTVIAHNITYRNHADGIVISESSRNLIWSNLSTGNRHHGIRLRNSANVRLQDNSSVANGLTGLYAISQDLSGTDRDLREDPYDKILAMEVVGGQFTANGSGPIHLDDVSRVTLFNIDLRTPQRQLGFRLGGLLLAFQVEALDILLSQKRALVLEPRSPVADATARR
jgi:poly(beta-D-mannuronate) C5 epimerase